jgi:RNA polymerase sigma-32 factor
MTSKTPGKLPSPPTSASSPPPADEDDNLDLAEDDLIEDDLIVDPDVIDLSPSPDLSSLADADDPEQDAAEQTLRDSINGKSHGTPSAETAIMRADPLAEYMARLRHLPLLSPARQQSLAVRYREKSDAQAAQILILSNLRLVVKIAREYQRRWTNLLELIQEGNVGLSEAIIRYDPYRNVKFTSYAQYWIRAMILNYLMNHFQPVRIGSTRAGRKLFYNLKKARAKLAREGFLNPTPALIAQELGVDERDVIDVSFHLDVPPLSLEANAPGYEDTTIGELLSDRTADSPETTVAADQFQAKIREAMNGFAATLKDARDLALWQRRLIADEPSTLSDLGIEFGVSKERIRQLEVRLKERFKTFLKDRMGPSFEMAFMEGD